MKTPSKIFTWNFHLKSTFSDFFFKKYIWFLKKCFFSMMKYYFLFGFFSVIKYVSLVTSETIYLPFPHNDSEFLTISQSVGENWSNSPDSAFVFMCTPRKCQLFLSKSGAACLQMDKSQISENITNFDGFYYDKKNIAI